MARKITSAWRISEFAWLLIFRIASKTDFREVFYVANCITILLCRLGINAALCSKWELRKQECECGNCVVRLCAWDWSSGPFRTQRRKIGTAKPDTHSYTSENKEYVPLSSPFFFFYIDISMIFKQFWSCH